MVDSSEFSPEIVSKKRLTLRHVQQTGIPKLLRACPFNSGSSGEVVGHPVNFQWCPFLCCNDETGRSGYGSDVSNVNSLTEPVSNHMPYHIDVGESIQHEVFDSYFLF